MARDGAPREEPPTGQVERAGERHVLVQRNAGVAADLLDALGDQVDALVAMNPAALKANLADLQALGWTGRVQATTTGSGLVWAP